MGAQRSTFFKHASSVQSETAIIKIASDATFHAISHDCVSVVAHMRRYEQHNLAIWSPHALFRFVDTDKCEDGETRRKKAVSSSSRHDVANRP